MENQTLPIEILEKIKDLGLLPLIKEVYDFAYKKGGIDEYDRIFSDGNPI